MNYQVTNTIDNSIETFETLEQVNDHIQAEIKWFNSPKENENNNGYDQSDFNVVESVEKFLIMDTTSNSGKEYIGHSNENCIEENAMLFDTKELAEKWRLENDVNGEWASVSSIDIFE